MPRILAVVSLKKRAEFLAIAANRKKWVAPAFIMQVAPHPPDQVLPETVVCRVGYTASKKMVGMAVDRNRAKRRLRALSREILAAHAVPGYDFVLIARSAVLKAPYATLAAELEKALRRFSLWREGV